MKHWISPLLAGCEGTTSVPQAEDNNGFARDQAVWRTALRPVVVRALHLSGWRWAAPASTTHPYR